MSVVQLGVDLETVSPAAAAVYVTASLAGIAMSLSSGEFLIRRELLDDRSLANWSVGRTRAKWLATGVSGRLWNAVFAYPRILTLHALRIILACAIMIGPPPLHAPSIIAMAVISTVLPLRSPLGSDGADQLVNIVFVSLALACTARSAHAGSIALTFITAQVCLAYLTAGAAKLASPEWRRGSALAGILSTTVYGSSPLAAAIRGRPRLGRVSGWLVIVFECGFTAGLFLPDVLFYAVLGAGLLFHAGTAFVMHLNSFFWSFTATYPALCYVHFVVA